MQEKKNKMMKRLRAIKLNLKYQRPILCLKNMLIKIVVCLLLF